MNDNVHEKCPVQCLVGGKFKTMSFHFPLPCALVMLPVPKPELLNNDARLIPQFWNKTMDTRPTSGVYITNNDLKASRLLTPPGTRKVVDG